MSGNTRDDLEMDSIFGGDVDLGSDADSSSDELIKESENQEQEVQEQPSAAEEAPNILTAAVEQVKTENAQKQAQSLIDKPAYFTFEGVKEAIEDKTLTFEELCRIKSKDFTKLGEAKSVQWSVSYGTYTKMVAKPEKQNIYELKRQIETSSDFITQLKEANDKNPDFTVTPKPIMKSKGKMASYKGMFSCIDDARASDKNICYIPSENGTIYELRKTPVGECITESSCKGLDYTEEEYFKPAYPLIPNEIISKIIGFFINFSECENGYEALADIYWDKETESFVADTPLQVVSKETVLSLHRFDSRYESDRYVHYAQVHSHNEFAADFSEMDDEDEQSSLVYIVIGRLNNYFPDISVRVNNGGKFLNVNPEEVLEMFPYSTDYDESWNKNVLLSEYDVQPIRWYDAA